MAGPQALSIWQYILLGGPSQTYAAYSGSILKHRENYVDLMTLKSPYSAEGGFGYYDGDPFSQYPSLPIEGGRSVSNAFSLSTSIRPSIITSITIALFIAQLVLAGMCASSVSMEWPKGPRMITWYSLTVGIGFTLALASSLFHWAIESEYKAYVPLVTGTGLGCLSNWCFLLLISMWTIDQSGLVGDASQGEERIKQVALCITYFIFSVGSVAGYGHSLIHGYQQYISRFGEVRSHIAEQSYRERMYMMQQTNAQATAYAQPTWGYHHETEVYPYEEPEEKVEEVAVVADLPPPTSTDTTVPVETKGKRVHDNPFDL
jgi:hypothetical protein